MNAKTRFTREKDTHKNKRMEGTDWECLAKRKELDMPMWKDIFCSPISYQRWSKVLLYGMFFQIPYIHFSKQREKDIKGFFGENGRQKSDENSWNKARTPTETSRRSHSLSKDNNCQQGTQKKSQNNFELQTQSIYQGKVLAKGMGNKERGIQMDLSVLSQVGTRNQAYSRPHYSSIKRRNEYDRKYTATVYAM